MFQLDPSEAMAVNLLLESFEHRGRGHRASTMAVFDHPNAQTLRPTLAFTMRLPDGTRLEVLNAPVWLLTTHVLIEHPYQFSNEEDAGRLYAYFRAIVSELSPGAKSPPIENGDWVGDLRRQFGEMYDDATRRGCITPTGTRGEYRLSVLFAAKFSWTLLPTVSRVLSWRTMLRNRRLLRELRAAGLLTD
ncbi:MAG: hypothetical protein K2Q20_10410 [Phycisphaerales bacterium]|nr:hypothetical protein [Phycisphaerales bacterium]